MPSVQSWNILSNRRCKLACNSVHSVRSREFQRLRLECLRELPAEFVGIIPVECVGGSFDWGQYLDS